MGEVDGEKGAVSRSGGAASSAAAPDSPPTARKAAPNGRGGLLVFLLVAAAGILLLVLMNFKNRAQSHSERAAGPHLRVQGVLKPRTLRRRDDACEYRFTLTSQEGPGTARELEVRLLRCTVPDNLRDVPGEPTEVIAEGKLVAAGHFEASQLMVRNAWKFEMNERAARGERAPHAVPASP